MLAPARAVFPPPRLPAKRVGNTACLRWAPDGPGRGLDAAFWLRQYPANPYAEGLLLERSGRLQARLAETVSGMGNFGNGVGW